MTENLVGQMQQSSVWTKSTGDHPLQTSWAFWYDKKQVKKTDETEFRNKLHKIGSFDTVESFWKVQRWSPNFSTLHEYYSHFSVFHDTALFIPTEALCT